MGGQVRFGFVGVWFVAAWKARDFVTGRVTPACIWRHAPTHACVPRYPHLRLSEALLQPTWHFPGRRASPRHPHHQNPQPATPKHPCNPQPPTPTPNHHPPPNVVTTSSAVFSASCTAFPNIPAIPLTHPRSSSPPSPCHAPHARHTRRGLNRGEQGGFGQAVLHPPASNFMPGPYVRTHTTRGRGRGRGGGEGARARAGGFRAAAALRH